MGIGLAGGWIGTREKLSPAFAAITNGKARSAFPIAIKRGQQRDHGEQADQNTGGNEFQAHGDTTRHSEVGSKLSIRPNPDAIFLSTLMREAIRMIQRSGYDSVCRHDLGQESALLNEGQIVHQRKNPAHYGAGSSYGLERRISRRSHQVFIDSKKSLLFLDWRSLSSRNSMASTVPMGDRMRRRT